MRAYAKRQQARAGACLPEKACSPLPTTVITELDGSPQVLSQPILQMAYYQDRWAEIWQRDQHRWPAFIREFRESRRLALEEEPQEPITQASVDAALGTMKPGPWWICGVSLAKQSKKLHGH